MTNIIVFNPLNKPKLNEIPPVSIYILAEPNEKVSLLPFKDFQWDHINDLTGQEILTLYMGRVIMSFRDFDSYFDFVLNPAPYLYHKNLDIDYITNSSIKRFLRQKLTKAQHHWFYLSKNTNYVKLNMWWREQQEKLKTFDDLILGKIELTDDIIIQLQIRGINLMEGEQ